VDKTILSGLESFNGVWVKRLRPEAKLPVFSSQNAAGADLHACIDEPVTLHGGGRYWMKVPTGIALQIPQFCHGEVRPRSGLAAKYGVTVLNALGTIDSDYRGEVSVLLINFGQAFTITPGMRIAQLVIMAHLHHPTDASALFRETDELDVTARGDGGFGSTGV
jgi:dUTP pyrophosphatase